MSKIMFQPQKVPNGSFESWRTETLEPTKTYPHYWNNTDYFGTSAFSRVTALASGSYACKMDNDNLVTNFLISPLIPVQNGHTWDTGTPLYTLSGWHFATGQDADCQIAINQYDGLLNLLTNNTILSFGGVALNTLVRSGLTIGGAAASPDVVLETNTSYIEIYLEAAAEQNGSITFDDVSLLGALTKFEFGAEVPYAVFERISQKKGKSSSGGILAAEPYGQKKLLKTFKFNLSLNKWAENYKKMYNLLNSPDVRFTSYCLNLIDENGDKYYGRFIGDFVEIRAAFYNGADVSLTFQELPF